VISDVGAWKRSVASDKSNIQKYDNIGDDGPPPDKIQAAPPAPNFFICFSCQLMEKRASSCFILYEEALNLTTRLTRPLVNEMRAYDRVEEV
jgi:hypothetical protein